MTPPRTIVIMEKANNGEPNRKRLAIRHFLKTINELNSFSLKKLIA